jgi:glycosyltransferase involved in cell wall biosynthesis
MLVFIGRLTATKKLEQILYAVSVLKLRGIETNVLFVGDGPVKNILNSEAINLGLTKNVHFFGSCYDEDTTAKLIYAADVCVSPGEVGLTAIHALSFGTPVITHGNPDFQMPEFEAITHGYNGMLFPMDSVDSLADSIQEWIQSNSDRAIVRTRCRQVIDSYYNPHHQLSVFQIAVNQCTNSASNL